MSLATIWGFMKCLPELINLYQALEKAAQEAEIERKVQGDIVTIHDAFQTNDPSKLNALFNSK